jgi:hypothetical protein
MLKFERQNLQTQNVDVNNSTGMCVYVKEREREGSKQQCCLVSCGKRCRVIS